MPDIPTVVAARGDQADDYHGELVADPYRWLEDTDSPETRAWIRAQNDRTEAFLAAVPGRPALRARLRQLWDHPRHDVPFRAGPAWFQRRNSGLQDQSVLYVMASPEDEGRVLLDPNLLSSDGTVAVASVAVSDDGSLLAYATSSGGSDWMTWHVRDVGPGTDRADLVEWSRYGAAAWREVTGFYYSATDRPEPGAELTGQVGLVRILFHALGAAPGQDRLVFEAPEEPEQLPHATVTEDGRFLVISVARGTNPEVQLLVLDHAHPDLGLRALVPGFSCRAEVAGNLGTTFFVVTDDQAERRRLVAIDLDHPGRAEWTEVVPEGPALLVGARICGGRLVCHHLQDACSRLSVVELDGAHVRDLPLPSIASLAPGEDGTGIEGRSDSPLVHFGLCSFIDPGSLWSHDVRTGETRRLPGRGGTARHRRPGERAGVRDRR